MEIIENIKFLAKGRFDGAALEQFLDRFKELSTGNRIIDSILQISTDEGDELEIGFFTTQTIVDITLSQGRVYSYSYPLSQIQDFQLTGSGTKWVLTITGEKKFDYNVVKPGSSDSLKKYESSLRQYLGERLTVN